MKKIQSRSNESHEEKGGAEKQSPEEIIRDLQGIFCGGRYRSWVLSRDIEKSITGARGLRRKAASSRKG